MFDPSEALSTSDYWAILDDRRDPVTVRVHALVDDIGGARDLLAGAHLKATNRDMGEALKRLKMVEGCVGGLLQDAEALMDELEGIEGVSCQEVDHDA